MRYPNLFLGFLAFSSLMLVATSLRADSYKSMNISLPFISFGGEAVGRFEWNLKGKAALGLEINVMQQTEFYTDEEIEEKNGDSLLMKGAQAALFYSQYSNSKMMSGGFWGIGVGYRSVEADWLQTPGSAQDLGGAALNTDGKVRHELRGSGATAHARFGYRYVAESIPFSLGAYLGVRHFQNTLQDAEKEGLARTSDEDRTSLERRLTSRLEPGIELGLAF
jgi:hypothetical protein